MWSDYATLEEVFTLKHNKKTNAARILDDMNITYRIMEYEVDENNLDAVHVANSVGMPAEQVFKTLVIRGDKTGVLFAVIPGNGELDLKALAKVSGNKRTELVPLKEVLPLTGYIRGGCSPVGMKKSYPTYFEESCELFDEIAVSAGERGHQMILSPIALVKLVNGTLVDIIV
jgi:Cys-tRNA(Pro)/Cys-tRNA(Cys) deacylase